MIFDPWLGGDLSDHKGKFDTRKEECPLVWGIFRGVGISAQAVNIISIMIIQIILPWKLHTSAFSTEEQNEACQIEALKKHGIEKWFTEKISGKSMDRPQLQAMLDYVRETNY